MPSWWERHNQGGTYWEAAAGDYMNTRWGKKERRTYANSYANVALQANMKGGAGATQVRWENQSGYGNGPSSSYRRIGTETDKKLIGMRKEAFERSFYAQRGMKAWQGNEWMKKTLDMAWDKDEFGIRSAYTARMASVSETGGENSIRTSARGYGQYDEDTLSRLTHTYAAKAQEVYGQAQRDKEADKMVAERRARGGMGSRGSTLLTGGREGVLAEAKTKKRTLIGEG